MIAESVAGLLVRELRAFAREVDAYPSDEAVWQSHPALPNTGGTLALHAAGNLQHFVGAVLGGSGYVRDRDAEFARRGVSRAELISGLESAIASVQDGLRGVTQAQLDDWYPLPVAKHRIRTGEFLMHLASHLAYHLGQLDYHRRIVTGDARGVGAVAPAELPSAVAVGP